ncbi:MAG TPA: helix-turn-helix transcriptional regulator [Solirubrobacteraceae bacterium]|nr:helix-turn-helix transcriptional regulator [Solirubrobacteraceae bacterium]
MEGQLQRAFGENLRAHRKRAGISQEAFAQQLEIHRTYLGGIERGERNLTLNVVERLAARVKLDPLELLSARR